MALIALILIMSLQGGKSGVDSVTLDHETAEIAPQDTLTLTATVLDANGQELKDETLTWSSSNAAVATVKDGVVTGVTEGKAKITVKAGKRSADCTVTVTNDAIEVKSLKLDQDKAEMRSAIRSRSRRPCSPQTPRMSSSPGPAATRTSPP